MDRLRLAAIECNYKEIDRQLKEDAFMHKLNDNNMLVEITRELTKNRGGSDVRTEQV